MKKQKNSTMIYSFIISAVNLSIFTVSWLLFSTYSVITIGYWRTFIAIYIVCISIYIYLTSIYDAFAIGRRKISENIFSTILSCFFSNLVFYFLQTATFKTLSSFLYIIISFIFQFFANILMFKLFHSLYYKNYIRKETLVVYNNKQDLSKVMSTPYFDIKYNLLKCIKKTNSFKRMNIDFNKYETIFISGVNSELRDFIIKECIYRNIESFVIPHVGDVIMNGSKYVEESFIPIVAIKRATLNPLYLLEKRLFDIIVAGCAAIVLLPFMLFTSLAIKIYDGGPILYKQIRLTKDGKEFTILKFRSMKVDAEKDGIARLVSENDDRITPIGRIIRMIRFDELPQIFNILKGDMSIVGPRPERPEIAKQYENIYPSFKLRLQVKAGLTGYAQIYGKYNTEPIDKLKMDLYYINNMSFLYDIKLCFMTVKTLFMKESTEAVDAGSITASKIKNVKQ